MTHVQFITHCTDKYDYLDSARMALEGGCRWIQLRMKDFAINEVRAMALKIKDLCNQYHATFIIDDNVELALELRADGVHLGKLDMPVDEARRILGSHYIIGGTANTLDDVKRLYHLGVNYIGLGPYRYTTTKRNLSPILGLEGYREIIKQMKDIPIPIVAIGGITKEDLVDIMSTGVNGIALSGSVLRAEKPVEEMKTIMNTLRYI